MRILRLLKTEFLKQKGSFLWAVIFLIPLGTTGAALLDIYLRQYDKFATMAIGKGFTLWEALLLESHNNIGWGRFIPIFIGVICAVVYYTEYKSDSWKNILSLPIEKRRIYFSKFITILLFSLILITLNSLGLILIGTIYNFPGPTNWLLFAKYVLYQFCAIMGVAAIHNWLSSYFKNMVIPIFMGVGGIVVSSVFTTNMPHVGKYFPYVHQYLIGGWFTEGYNGLDPFTGVYEGIISGLIILFLGYLEFRNRDIV